ncbi:MAG: hypothetical protein VYE68_15820 [Acidobacteriota bacterium]|nr:hypothetical protein [Acidobacteriota bacterium]
MRDPDVEDTGGVDRGTFRVPLGPWLVRHVSLLRIRVAQWLENRHTAERWLYTLFVVGPPWVLRPAWSGRRRGAVAPTAFWKLFALVVLSSPIRLFLYAAISTHDVLMSPL